jgi:hypothetical protein
MAEVWEGWCFESDGDALGSMGKGVECRWDGAKEREVMSSEWRDVLMWLGWAALRMSLKVPWEAVSKETRRMDGGRRE